LRILHIGKYYAPFRGGVETYLQDSLKALALRGHACVALVHNHATGLRNSDEQHGDAQAGGSPWRVVRSATWASAFFTPVSPGFRNDLQHLIDSFQPDVIHAHFPNPSACWLLTLRSTRAIPLVIHWHADVLTDQQGPVMRLLYRLYRPLEKRLLDRAGAIIATSRCYLESSDALQGHLHKCHVVPLGLDPERIMAPDVSLAPSPGPSVTAKFQILAIGRLTYYKGFGILIRAMKELPNSELTVIGQGSLAQELSGLARQLDVEGRVRFLGGVDDAELREHLHNCDCLCLPSIERTEAFGLVLLEAMAFGKPTVVSNVSGSGMGWVVEDGVTGLHTEPGNAHALARALETLRLDPVLARNLGRAGKQRFDSTFSIGPSVDGLEDVYEGVVTAAQGQ